MRPNFNDCLGEKTIEYDGDFWADHDDDCHGDPMSFIDDEDFEDGFKWSCCDDEIRSAGCEKTTHCR